MIKFVFLFVLAFTSSQHLSAAATNEMNEIAAEELVRKMTTLHTSIRAMNPEIVFSFDKASALQIFEMEDLGEIDIALIEYAKVLIAKHSEDLIFAKACIITLALSDLNPNFSNASLQVMKRLKLLIENKYLTEEENAAIVKELAEQIKNSCQISTPNSKENALFLIQYPTAEGIDIQSICLSCSDRAGLLEALLNAQEKDANNFAQEALDRSERRAFAIQCLLLDS